MLFCIGEIYTQGHMHIYTSLSNRVYNNIASYMKQNCILYNNIDFKAYMCVYIYTHNIYHAIIKNKTLSSMKWE